MKLIQYAIGSMLAVLGVFFVTPQATQAQVRGNVEHVESYAVDLTLSETNELAVRETITYDFANEPDKHGIFRDVPFLYTDNTWHPIRTISITDNNGKEYHYETTIGEANIRWKIGDANTEVSGQKVYVIEYTFQAPVSHFDSRNIARLAWNVTGHEWYVPINHATATVRLPQNARISSSAVELRCFTGFVGSDGQDCTTAFVDEQQEAQFTTSRTLYYGEGFTIQIDMPAEAVQPFGSLAVTSPKNAQFQVDGAEPSPLMDRVTIALSTGAHTFKAKQPLYPAFETAVAIESNATQAIHIDVQEPWYLPLLRLYLPLLVAVFYLLWAIREWWRKGRDPKTSSVIVTEFEVPDHLSPLAIGYLMNHKIEPKEVTAHIIYLATHGYITIIQDEADGWVKVLKKPSYRFQKTADLPAIGEAMKQKQVVTEIDVAVMNALFGTDPVGTEKTMNAVQKTLLTTMPDIRTATIAFLEAGEYLPRDNKRNKTQSLLFAGLSLTVGIAGTIFFFANQLFSIWFVVALAGVLGFVFGLVMNRRTIKGAQTRRTIEGYKKYLEVAEKDRITFFNDPKKYQELFEMVLPFAMVLGVEKVWAKHFEDLYTAESTWLQGNNAFTPLLLMNAVQSVSTQAAIMRSLNASASSASGVGGAVGGGFGGGGGGSW